MQAAGKVEGDGVSGWRWCSHRDSWEARQEMRPAHLHVGKLRIRPAGDAPQEVEHQEALVLVRVGIAPIRIA